MGDVAMLAHALRALKEAYPDLIRIGRTHLQDATPLKFAQEVSGWRELVEAPCRMLRTALPEVEVLVSTENRDPYTYL